MRGPLGSDGRSRHVTAVFDLQSSPAAFLPAAFFTRGLGASMLDFNALSLNLVHQFRHQISKLRELGNGLLRCFTSSAICSTIQLNLYRESTLEKNLLDFEERRPLHTPYSKLAAILVFFLLEISPCCLVQGKIFF